MTTIDHPTGGSDGGIPWAAILGALLVLALIVLLLSFAHC